MTVVDSGVRVERNGATGASKGVVATPVPGVEVPPDQKIATLRDLRAVITDFQRILDGVRDGSYSLAAFQGYFAQVRTQLEGLVAQVGQFGSFDKQEDSDAIRHILNVWEQMKVNPLIEGSITFGNGGVAQDQARYLNVLDDGCDRIVLQIEILTIPRRLNELLAQGEVGSYIPFHEVFADELPNHDDRVRALRYLGWSPNCIKGGLIDVSTGLVYRFSENPFWRWLSVVGVVVALIAATVLVYFSSYFSNFVSGWPFHPQDANTVLAGWLAVLVGVGVHVAVGTAKRLQNQTELPPPLPLGAVPQLANAKFGQFVLKVALALIGFYGLALAGGNAVSGGTPLSQIALLPAFLTGYSLDSVVELFGVSAERRAASQLAGLQKQLGTSGDGTS